jgi:hypothetical protein
MIKKNRFNAGFFIIGGILFATILLCTRDYNPFEDPSNAKAEITYKSFDNGDTLNIFTSETVSVSIYVPELIDSFEIDAPGNRFFTNGRNIYKSGNSNWHGSGPYNLIFSFADTGNKTINLFSYRDGEKTSIDELWCYVRSPLHQENITGVFREPVKLSTDSVGDKGLNYIWDFGRGSVVRCTISQITTTIEYAGIDGKGTLKVTDGRFTSPEVSFNFGFIDTTPPEIKYPTNNGYIKIGDTIKTSKPDFNFSVIISDQGKKADSASINGHPFDTTVDLTFLKFFGKIDSLGKPLPLIIYAIDNLKSRNSITDTVFLVYDPAVNLKSMANFTILIPSQDSSVYNTRSKNIFGYIEQFGDRSIDFKIRFSINGKIKDSIYVAGEGKKSWSWTAPLDFNENILKATLFNKAGDSLSSLQKVLIYNKELIDTTPPVILEATINGKSPGIYTTESSSIDLKILAFDEKSGIDSLYVNGTPYSQKEDYIWIVPVTNLRHIPNGNVCAIKAVDRAGFTTDTSIRIYKNSPPFVTKGPQPPLPLIAGKDYYDSIMISDPDYDSVTISKLNDNTSLTISKNGKIHWCPDINDTGGHQINVILSDNYESKIYSFNIYVIDSSKMRSVVKFENLIGKFPNYLKAGKDSLNLLLSTVAGTGKEPFRYYAKVLEKTVSLPVLDGNRIIWHPLEADTGLKHLKVWVIDSYNNSDTLFPLINIIPKGKEAWIDGNFSPLNMSDKGLVETLHFKIYVDGTQTTGHFNAFVIKNGITNSAFVDSFGNFSVIVSSADKDFGNDTLKIFGQYGDLFTDPVRKPIFYGYKPVSPSAPKPLMDSLINDSIVNFSWNGNTATEDGIFYTFNIGSCPEPQTGIIRNISKIDTVLRRSGTYCWRVSASNGKATTEGPVWRFRIRVPGQVEFLTDETDFEAAYEAQRDSVIVPLNVVQGTGKAPFTFKAHFADKDTNIPVIDNRISFLPANSDTGYRKLIITVNDSIGNSDTITPTIQITPENRPCKVNLDTSGLSIVNKKLDLSSAVAAETLVFKITDPDPEITERHTITISQLNTVVSGRDDSKGNIYVLIDPNKADVSSDILKVTVTDRAGHFCSDSIEIYYGFPPKAPSQPSPQNNAVLTKAVKILSWSCSDPDKHPLSYDIYFGKSNPLLKIATGIKDTFYTIPFEVDTGKYFWKVTAVCPRFTVESSVWTFTTDLARRDFIINTTYGVDGAGISQVLYNIPVLVRLDTSNFDFKSVGGDGKDLWFTKDSSSKILPHEIDTWDSASGKANVWVLLDKLDPFNGTQFIRTHSSSMFSDTAQVFDTADGFEGVWHMQESQSGIGTQSVYKDATRNRLDGDDMVFSNIKDGVIGNGEWFDGTRDLIRLPQNITVLSGVPAISAEAWFKSNGSSQSQTMISISDLDPTIPRIELDLNSQGQISVSTTNNSNPYPISLTTTQSYTDNRWHHVTGIVDFSNREMVVYVDGVQAGIFSNIFLPNTSSANRAVMSAIGSRATGSEYLMNGSLDEVRISKVRRSAAWMKFCYMNQKPESKVVNLR